MDFYGKIFGGANIFPYLCLVKPSKKMENKKQKSKVKQESVNLQLVCDNCCAKKTKLGKYECKCGKGNFWIEQQLNENMDLSEDFAITNLFREYEKQYEPEYNEENWIKYHYGNERKGGVNALKESLELIGDGEISDKGDKSLMYKEMLKNNTLILVIHASLKKPLYGGMEGYKYSIGVYRNNPRTQQIGGGYGASGIMSIEHTRLLSYDDYDIVHYNRNLISKVCEDVKKYAVENL